MIGLAVSCQSLFNFLRFKLKVCNMLWFPVFHGHLFVHEVHAVGGLADCVFCSQTGSNIWILGFKLQTMIQAAWSKILCLSHFCYNH